MKRCWTTEIAVLLVTAAVLLASGCRKEEAVSETPAVEKGRPTSAPTAVVRKEVRVLLVADGFNDTPGIRNFVDTTLKSRIESAFHRLPGTEEPDGARILVKTSFVEGASTAVSALGITFSQYDPCYFVYDTTVLDKITKRDPVFNADAYAVIVGGTEEVGNGCADGKVFFLREVKSEDESAIAHEMGHALAGLYDEYAGNPIPQSGCVRWRNCTTTPRAPQWPLATGTVEGCNEHNLGVYRPTNSCIMLDHGHSDFCSVCKSNLIEVLKGTGSIGQQPPSDGGCVVPDAKPWKDAREATYGIDVLAIVDNKQYIKVVRAEPADEESLKPRVVTGEWLAVVRNRGKIVGVTPIAIDDTGNAFRARRYPGTSIGRESVVGVSARLLQITLVGMKVEDLDDSQLTLHFQKLADARRFFVVDDAMIARLLVQSPDRGYALQEAVALARR